MGKRLEKAAEGPEEGADDLQILHPDRSATIAGRVVNVREYGFVEGLRLRPAIQPLLDDLHAFIGAGSLPEIEEILTMLAAHTDAVMEAVCVAADVEMDWLETLSQDDGHHLLMIWWAVNGPFYIRSVFQRVATQRALANPRAGEISIARSSAPDTETTPASVE